MVPLRSARQIRCLLLAIKCPKAVRTHVSKRSKFIYRSLGWLNVLWGCFVSLFPLKPPVKASFALAVCYDLLDGDTSVLSYLKSKIVVRSEAGVNNILFSLFHVYSLVGLRLMSIYRQKQDFLAFQYDLIPGKVLPFFPAYLDHQLPKLKSIYSVQLTIFIKAEKSNRAVYQEEFCFSMFTLAQQYWLHSYLLSQSLVDLLQTAYGFQNIFFTFLFLDH